MSSTSKTRLQKEANRPLGTNSDGARLSRLLGGAPTAIAFLTYPDYRFSYVNDFYVRALGRSGPEDLLGLTVRDALPELQETKIPQILDEVSNTGSARCGNDLEVAVRSSVSAPPEDKYFDFIFQPTFDSAGRVEGIFVLAVDVTDRAVSRHAAEEREERLRLAHEAAQVGTWEWDPVENTRTHSRETHRMYGTDPEVSSDEVYRVWASRVYSTDWPLVKLEMSECQRTGVLDLEYRYEHPSDGLRYHHTKGRRMKGGSRFYGVLSDTTNRKRREDSFFSPQRENGSKQLASLEGSQRLAAIVESSDDAIIGKDLNGVVTSWNPGAEQMFGFRSEEMIGQSIRKIVPPVVFADEDRIMSAVAHGERTEHFETIRRRKDGECFEVSLTLSPVLNEAGEISGVASISRDISQQKKVEKALHTSERLASVGRLAATIAHEINNPLEAVTNLVFLARNCMQDSNGKVFLDQAQEELARVALLTKQTLGFYRENKGARPVTLGELVTPLVSVFSARARNKRISIDTDIRENPTLMAIPGEIRQLFANLLNNSIDAVSDRGRIMIRISDARERGVRKRAGVRLTVCDNGPGIAQELRKKLFEPFFTTKQDVGTGLGLWVSSSILRKHDGNIRLRSSVAPGKSWTVFSVFLPTNSETLPDA